MIKNTLDRLINAFLEGRLSDLNRDVCVLVSIDRAAKGGAHRSWLTVFSSKGDDCLTRKADCGRKVVEIVIKAVRETKLHLASIQLRPVESRSGQMIELRHEANPLSADFGAIPGRIDSPSELSRTLALIELVGFGHLDPPVHALLHPRQLRQHFPVGDPLVRSRTAHDRSKSLVEGREVAKPATELASTHEHFRGGSMQRVREPVDLGHDVDEEIRFVRKAAEKQVERGRVGVCFVVGVREIRLMIRCGQRSTS